MWKVWGSRGLTAQLKGSVIIFLRLPLQRNSENSVNHFWWSMPVIAFKLTVLINPCNRPLCYSEAAEDHNHRNSIYFFINNYIYKISGISSCTTG